MMTMSIGGASRGHRRQACLLLVMWFIVGSAGASSTAALPYDAWYLGISAPPYMDVWVETADVSDVRGQVFLRAGGGAASISHDGNPAGWEQLPGGLGRRVIGADLPQKIHVRWQSLVEPQTYRVTLQIPDEASKLMLTQVVSIKDPTYRNWRKAIAIGLAPGGIAKVWVTGPVGEPVEVLCQQAEVEPKGPSQGLLGPETYAYSFEQLDAGTRRYVNSKAIPYDSWKRAGGSAR